MPQGRSRVSHNKNTAGSYITQETEGRYGRISDEKTGGKGDGHASDKESL